MSKRNRRDSDNEPEIGLTDEDYERIREYAESEKSLASILTPDEDDEPDEPVDEAPDDEDDEPDADESSSPREKCERCSRRFKPSRHNQRFCSRSCAAKQREAEQREKRNRRRTQLNHDPRRPGGDHRYNYQP